MRHYASWILSLGGVLTACTLQQPAAERIANVAAMTPLYGMGGEYILAYDDGAATLTLFEVRDEAFIERASLQTPDVLQKAVAVDDRIVVAYGYARGKLEQPIRIMSYDRSLQDGKELLTRSSERNEVSELIAAPDRNAVFLSFFTSKYDTSAGWLSLDDGTFQEAAATRLGTQYDRAGDLLVQGRPYGDGQGEDGDVTLLSENQPQRLPSFRGVSEVRFAQLDDDAEVEILIADGWHQNYGEIAEPRVSLLDLKDGAYALETLAVLRPQYAVSSLHLFEDRGKKYLCAIGNSGIYIIDLSDRSVRHVYTSDSWFFGAAFVGQSGNTVHIAVKEEDLWIKSIVIGER